MDETQKVRLKHIDIIKVKIPAAWAQVLRRIVSLVLGFIVGLYGFLLALDHFDFGFQSGMRSAVGNYHEVISKRMDQSVNEETTNVAAYALESYIESLELELKLSDSDAERSEMLSAAYVKLKRLRGDESKKAAVQ